MIPGDDRWVSDAGGDGRFRSAAGSGQPDSDGLADEETPGRRRSTDEDSVRARRFNLEDADTTPRPAGGLDGELASARRTSDNETRRGPDDETRPSSNNETWPSSDIETRRSSNNETRRSSDNEAVTRWRDLDDQTETTRRRGSSDSLQAPLRATDDEGLRRGPGQDGEPAARWHSLGDDLDDRLVTSADLPAAPFRITFDDRPGGARSATSDASIPVQPGRFDADRDEQIRFAAAGALPAGAERIDAEPAANATASEAVATESATGNATTDEEPTADDPTAESVASGRESGNATIDEAVASEAANRDETTSEAAPNSTTVGEAVDGGAANRDVTIGNATTVEEPIASGSTSEAVTSGRESGDATGSETATVETAAGETAVSGFLPGRRRAAIVPGTEKGGESSAPMVSGYVIGDPDDDRLVSTPVTPPARETIGGADETTADEATVHETPVHEKPAREKPAREKPAREKPARETTVDKSTVQETPDSESKVGEPTTDETLAHETPADETPVGETMARETTVGGTTGGETTDPETTIGGTTGGGTTAPETTPDPDPASRDAQKAVAPGAVDDKGEHPLRPGDVDETPISFWADEAVEHFRAEWHEVKADFVDDPVTALTRARDLLTDAVNELTGSLLAERDDLDPLRETATPDTESMRMAMRGYREFLDRILSL